VTSEHRPAGAASQRVCDLHRAALVALRKSDGPFLVGGAYALARHTGLRSRPVKDLDLVTRRRDLPAVRAAFESAGWSTRIAFPHWLAKAVREDEVVDILFASGNGEARVDDAWFANARPGRLFGVAVSFCPPEEEIWMRSYVMERERYDGADVAHLIRACGPSLDWERLLERFGPHWRLLLAHVVLFDFIYPTEKDRVPAWVKNELLARLRSEPEEEPTADERVCRGTLLSRVEYQVDVRRWGYADARVAPRGSMTKDQAREWTRAGFADAAKKRPRNEPHEPKEATHGDA
jgi:hypothetical protein